MVDEHKRLCYKNLQSEVPGLLLRGAYRIILSAAGPERPDSSRKILPRMAAQAELLPANGPASVFFHTPYNATFRGGVFLDRALRIGKGPS